MCGAQLPLTSTSEEPPVVREGINCKRPMEFAYYSSKKFKEMCVLIVAVTTAQSIRLSRNSFRLSSPFAKSVVPVARSH